ncbi:Syntaxin-61 -like protein [Gossypium arboreum]|uniref:Syntaxin-61-like protein n=1 Tax=Gossypium arboreum TaxID=29729 RepID=A0A0B0PIA8_GOSAR|nr:Syntaxin-61 -like protein [Gossypium arboreum]
MGLEADVASSEPPGKKLIIFQCNQRALRTLTLLAALKFKLKHDMSMIINPMHSVFGISHHFRELNAPPFFSILPNCGKPPVFTTWFSSDWRQSSKMSKARDPFYIVKEEIQESFSSMGKILPDTGEQVHLTKELLANCEIIEWQVDELNKTIDVATIDPSWYGIDNRELESRRRWTITARTQVGDMKKSVVARKENGNSASAMRRELMKLLISHQSDRSYQYSAEDNDDFIASKSDRQMLLIKQQDEELDELSASVERIGGVGLTIHEELLAQMSV